MKTSARLPAYSWIACGAACLLALLACSDSGSAERPPAVASPELLNPAPGHASFAGANFWNIDWQGQQEYFRKDAEFSATSDPWRPDLLQELRPYRVLRFMDWNDTNGVETRQAHYSTRKLPAEAQNQPVSLHWQIDLCNRINADCWINLHHTSNAEDWSQVAGYLRTGLKPALRVYIELSNEVWNGAFPQGKYAQARSRELDLPGQIGSASYYVQESVRMFEVFERAFAGQQYRLVKVLAGQAAWTGPCEAHAKALRNTRINPRNVRPDVYAIAPYVPGESIAEMRRELATVRAWVAASARCAQSMDLPLITYEGGTDSFSLGRACVAIQHAGEMRSLYHEYLRTITDAGVRGPFMQYTHSGACWGLKEKTGDPPEISPKYQGLMDWLVSAGR